MNNVKKQLTRHERCQKHIKPHGQIKVVLQLHTCTTTRCRTPREKRFEPGTTAAAPAAHTRYPSSPPAATLLEKTQGFVPRFPPTQTPCNIHAATTVTTSQSCNLPKSPLPLVTTSQSNHIPFVTTSLGHHFPSSPPFVIVSTSLDVLLCCYVV